MSVPKNTPREIDVGWKWVSKQSRCIKERSTNDDDVAIASHCPLTDARERRRLTKIPRSAFVEGKKIIWWLRNFAKTKKEGGGRGQIGRMDKSLALMRANPNEIEMGSKNKRSVTKQTPPKKKITGKRKSLGTGENISKSIINLWTADNYCVLLLYTYTEIRAVWQYNYELGVYTSGCIIPVLLPPAGPGLLIYYSPTIPGEPKKN